MMNRVDASDGIAPLSTEPITGDASGFVSYFCEAVKFGLAMGFCKGMMVYEDELSRQARKRGRRAAGLIKATKNRVDQLSRAAIESLEFELVAKVLANPDFAGYPQSEKEDWKSRFNTLVASQWKLCGSITAKKNFIKQIKSQSLAVCDYCGCLVNEPDKDRPFCSPRCKRGAYQRERYLARQWR